MNVKFQINTIATLSFNRTLQKSELMELEISLLIQTAKVFKRIGGICFMNTANAKKPRPEGRVKVTLSLKKTT